MIPSIDTIVDFDLPKKALALQERHKVADTTPEFAE
jgi:hypothetical protein